MELYLTKELGCMEFAVGDDMVESLWVKIKGKANKVDVIVGVYNRLRVTAARMRTPMNHLLRN